MFNFLSNKRNKWNTCHKSCISAFILCSIPHLQKLHFRCKLYVSGMLPTCNKIVTQLKFSQLLVLV